MPSARSRADFLEDLVQIGIALSSDLDLHTLLERILEVARRFTGAEAGTLYLREADHLRFAVVQNDVLADRLGRQEAKRLLGEESLALTHGSLAGYVALSREIVNIADAYAIDPGSPFGFNPDVDSRTGYRTRSVLGVPLQHPFGTVVGVLQLINARDDQGRIVAFDPGYEDLGRSLASHAAVAIENAQLLENVERLNRHHELILNSAGDGIYGIDRAGMVTFVNAAAAKMTGWTAAELVDRPIHPVLHHSNADGTPHPWEQCPICAVITGETVPSVSDQVFWRKDATAFPVEYTCTPIQEGNELVGAVVTFRDATERKQAEVTARGAVALESVASLAAAAAHEINNPLNIIRGNLQLLHEEITGTRAVERLEAAIRAVDRIHDIVRRMNRITRIELVKQSPNLPNMLDFQKSSPGARAEADPQSKSS